MSGSWERDVSHHADNKSSGLVLLHLLLGVSTLAATVNVPQLDVVLLVGVVVHLLLAVAEAATILPARMIVETVTVTTTEETVVIALVAPTIGEGIQPAPGFEY